MLAEQSVPQRRRERDWDRGPCGVGEPGLLRPPQQDLSYRAGVERGGSASPRIATLRNTGPNWRPNAVPWPAWRG